MQVEADRNVPARRTAMQVVGWLAAVVPVVVGLATLDAPKAERAAPVLQANADAQGESRAPTDPITGVSKPVGDELAAVVAGP